MSLYSVAVLPVSGEKVSENNTRPNIIFIMSDDHAYQAISAYGSGLYSTPNFDRIASEGALLTTSMA